MKALILAAGQGTRLMPLTKDKPKAMVRVQGKPILEWIVQRVCAAGIDGIGLVVNFKQEIVRDYFGTSWNAVPITYIKQEKHAGTGDGIRAGEQWVQGKNFLVVYGDVIPEIKLVELVCAAPRADCVLVARKETEPWKYGCLEFAGNRVRRIVEKPVQGMEPSAWINSGVYRFSPRIFEAIKKTRISARGELEITDAINILAQEGTVSLIKWNAGIVDIGNSEDLRKSGSLL